MQTFITAIVLVVVSFIFVLDRYKRNWAYNKIEEDYQKTKSAIDKVDEQTATRLKDYFYERWTGRINRWILRQYMANLNS
jgi:hypothetical protein